MNVRHCMVVSRSIAPLTSPFICPPVRETRDDKEKHQSTDATQQQHGNPSSQGGSLLHWRRVMATAWLTVPVGVLLSASACALVLTWQRLPLSHPYAQSILIHGERGRQEAVQFRPVVLWSPPTLLPCHCLHQQQSCPTHPFIPLSVPFPQFSHWYILSVPSPYPSPSDLQKIIFSPP